MIMKKRRKDMLEGLREAMSYFAVKVLDAEKTEVLEINGRTYANKNLTRYDKPEYASAIQGNTLTALVDYIANCVPEFRGHMLVHIVSPTKVRLMSELDAERNRETLFETTANVSQFHFDEWYDQERFMIELQANFELNDDLAAIMKLAGNIEKKNDQTFSDNGTTQVATMQVGVASKADVIVPNPVTLVPFRTFQEVAQPASKFVFRIGDKEVPAFKIVEAENNIWKNEAIRNIKTFLDDAISEMPEPIRNKIVLIG